MSSRPNAQPHPRKDNTDFSREVGDRAERLKRRREAEQRRSTWFGLAVFGTVGWYIAIPTVLGAFLGVYLDANYPSERNYTIMLVLTGLVLGGVMAGFWMERERTSINREHEAYRNPKKRQKMSDSAAAKRGNSNNKRDGGTA